MAESKYAAKLRELGFEKLDTDKDAEVERRLGTGVAGFLQANPGLSRRDRRRLKKNLTEAVYFVADMAGATATFVRDETGVRWIKNGTTELSHLKIKNISLPPGVAASMIKPQ